MTAPHQEHGVLFIVPRKSVRHGSYRIENSQAYTQNLRDVLGGFYYKLPAGH